MDAFYELARVDYRYLAQAYDWSGAFEAFGKRKGSANLIDVACGSGKFPEALLAYADVGRSQPGSGFQIDYDLLDPSPFSIREARQALKMPFNAGAEFCCTLQDWNPPAGEYDIAWATHALYCVPAPELEQALSRMCCALSSDGFGFIAQGLRSGHYVSFYDRFLESLCGGEGTPYSDGDQIEATLRALGMPVRSRVLDYTTVVPGDRPQLLELYLQRCAFDDRFTLDEMLQREPLAGYLSSCHDEPSGEYRFAQRVGMTVFAHTEAGLSLCCDSAAGGR
jgi:SAM-dependent methyltransferase